MREFLAKRDELLFIDTPSLDERLNSILRAEEGQLPPILLFRRNELLSHLPISPDYRWVIVDGCRRTYACRARNILSLEIETDEDVEQAADLIDDEGHIIRQQSIKTITELRTQIWLHLNWYVVGKRLLSYAPFSLP